MLKIVMIVFLHNVLPSVLIVWLTMFAQEFIENFEMSVNDQHSNRKGQLNKTLSPLEKYM